MKYLFIFIIVSAVGTAGSIIKEEVPVEYIEFEPIEITVIK